MKFVQALLEEALRGIGGQGVVSVALGADLLGTVFSSSWPAAALVAGWRYPALSLPLVSREWKNGSNDTYNSSHSSIPY